MKMQQKLIICAAAAIVIGAVIALAAYLSAKDIKKVENEIIQQQAAEQQAAAEAAQNEAAIKPGETKPTTTTPTKLTYSQAVVKYADRRIQFDSNCVASPVISTFKNNTDIMLDNRAGVRRIITVDGTRHTIEGLDFKIVKMTAKTFPYTIQIDCGSGKNNANIFLQK